MNPEKLEALADEMIVVLQEQRRALGRLDVPALVECNTRSQALLEAMGATTAALDDPASALREKVLRVSIEAEATALVVRDALDIIRGMMGVESSNGLYDARGAVQTDERRLVARSI